MDERVSIRYEPRSDRVVECIIDVHDRALVGHAARLRVLRQVNVHDERPINVAGVMVERKIARLEPRNKLQFHRSNLLVYSYAGSMIDIEIHTQLRIDDGLLFDTTITQEEEMALSLRAEVSSNAKEIVDPHDAFDFNRNIAAVPAGTRFLINLMMFVGVMVVLLNSGIGVHDQFVPEPMVWFYDHQGRRGRTELPLLKSAMGSGVLASGIWFMVRGLLKKYMRLELHGVPQRICRRDTLRASKLLRGRSRVPLENVLIRVVACNMEKGQYLRGQGKSKRRVSFKEPARAVVLFEQNIPLIPAHARVETYVQGDIRFEPMFRALYPPQLVGKHHGLAVYWEVQLIHADLVDQEVVGPVDCFPWKDFITA